MPARRSRRTASTDPPVKAAQLAMAVPQVVAHRVARMAMAGPLPPPRGRREFHRMGAEKATAFVESWGAMAAEAARANQALVGAMAQMFWAPWLGGRTPARAVADQMQSAALGILDKGMAPVHRKAV